MTEEERNEIATKLFFTIEELLPEIGVVNFDKDEDELTFNYTINGDDIPMDFNMRILPKVGLISLISPFSFVVKEENRMNAAIAVTAVNQFLLNGSFDMNLRTGNICFRINTCYEDENIDYDVLNYLVAVSVNTVDRYNDHILALAKDIITLKQFVKWVEKINE